MLVSSPSLWLIIILMLAAGFGYKTYCWYGQLRCVKIQKNCYIMLRALMPVG